MILYDFQGHLSIGFVVVALETLTKTAGTESAKNLISISDMIVNLCLVLSSVVIIPIVEDVHLLQSFKLSNARHGFGFLWLPRSTPLWRNIDILDRMTLNLCLAQLTHIVDQVVIPDALLFLIVSHLVIVLDSVFTGHW